MSASLILLIVFVVAVIVGPFATLYALSSYRKRRTGAAPLRPRPPPDDDEPGGF